jgi:diguanylate cyclase (GGDEF)-like protein
MSHVLLVCEDPGRIETLTALLAEEPGLTLEVVPDAELRLAAADALPPDIVLADLGTADPVPYERLARMAVGDGVEAPVIALYGAGGPAEEEKAIAAGAGDALAWDQLSRPLVTRAIRYCMERADSRRALAQLAVIDDETGLARTPLFWEVLNRAVARARRNKDYLAVLAVSLKEAGAVPSPAAVVREAARRLAALLRASDTVARFEGDVLMVLVEGMPRVDDIQTVAEKIIEQVGAPMTIDGETVTLAPSVGITMFPTVSDTAEALVEDATQAMTAAIEAGATTFKFA